MSNEHGDRPAVERFEPLVAILLSVALALPLLRAGFVPTYDGLQHLLHGYLWNHLDDPGRTWSVFVERGAPITAWGFTWIFAPLERILGWRAAYQVTLAVIALGNAWGFRAVVNAAAGRRHPLGLLGFGVAMSWPVYMGFLPFAAASAVGLATVALALRPRALRPVEWFVLASLLLVTSMMHTMAAALAGVVVLAARPSVGADRPSRELVRTVAAGVPAFAVALAATAAGRETVASVGGESHLLWHTLATRVLDLADTSVGGPPWRSWPVLSAALAGAALTFVPSPRPGLRAAAVPAAACAIGGVVLALGLPFHTTAWEYLAPRPLGLAVALGIAALATRLPTRRDPAVVAVVVAFTAASLVWTAAHDRALARSAAAVTEPLEGDSALDARGWVLPVVYDVYGEPGPDAVAYAKPLANIGHVFVIEHGGMTPYLFATSPSMHEHAFRSDVRTPRVPRRSYFDAPARPELADAPRHLEAIRQSVLSAAPDYDTVVAWGDPETIAIMQTRGFEMGYADDRLAVGRFVGCPFEIDVVGPAEGPAPSVEFGWFPAMDGPRRALVTPVAPGRWSARAATAPCGDVWVRVRGGGPDGRATCEGATADTFVLPVTPELRAVPCRLVPVP